MNAENLRSELMQYSVSELELIIATQADVYTPQEMALIRDVLEARREAETEKRKERAAHDTLPCVLSLLIPVIGVVLGAIFLFSGDARNKETGKRCMVAALVSLILFSFLLSGGIIF